MVDRGAGVKRLRGGSAPTPLVHNQCKGYRQVCIFSAYHTFLAEVTVNLGAAALQ